MVIRLFQKQDCNAIAQLFHDTIREVNSRDYTPAQVKAWAPDNLHFCDWEQDCLSQYTYVAETETEIIGFAQLDTNGHIDCFFCHKNYQRCGVGTRLYQAIETKAVDLGLARLSVEVSITARAFFESRGFCLVKEQTVLCRGERLNNYVMEKSLNQLSVKLPTI